MTVYPVQGEPTRFRVESSSLECPRCGVLYSRLQLKWSTLRPGSECPKCRRQVEDRRRPGYPACALEATVVAKLDVRTHLVDVESHHPVGQCTCEHWGFTLGPKVKAMTRAQREALTQQQARNLRCSHIEAARTAAIDIAIGCHKRERGNNREREEAAP